MFILGFWLCWGFALGTALLLGPLRSVVNYARSYGWSERKEDMAVIVLVVLLVVVSFLLARFSAKRALAEFEGRTSKIVHTAVPVLAALTALYILMNPSIVNADSGKITSLSSQFTIGPYPDKVKMEELKKEGYTALVSLLHPAVMPFEPKLLNEEQSNAADVGLELVSLPMLPWVSDNLSSIDSLRRFIKTAKGKYYIHCYLGKDRVNIARRVIEQEKGIMPEMEKGLQHRSLDTVHSFERGLVYKLDDGVFLTPMPTQEEYLGYVVASSFKHIVSLTDPGEPESKLANEKEEKWLATYEIPYKVFYISQQEKEARMKQVIDSVKHLPKPLLIHSFRTSEPMAQQFLRLYK